MSNMSASRVASAVSSEQAIRIDEEGFTDKRCRSCYMRLSFDEVSVFLTTNSKKKPITKGEIEKAMKQDMICLSCYAVIVEKRTKVRKSVERVKTDKGINSEIVVQPNSRKVSGGGRCSSVSEKTSSKQSSRKIENKVEEIQFKKKKTDITMFANASFNGGVFLNSIPGQSI